MNKSRIECTSGGRISGVPESRARSAGTAADTLLRTLKPSALPSSATGLLGSILTSSLNQFVVGVEEGGGDDLALRRARVGVDPGQHAAEDANAGSQVVILGAALGRHDLRTARVVDQP